MWSGAPLKQNVYAAISYYLKQKFSETYPGINCGTEYLKKTSPKLPYVRIYKSNGEERGKTFDRDGVNATLQTYQIDVFANDKESTCETIADYVCEILSKNMEIIREPFPNYSDTTEYRYTAQARWLVGANNIIKW